MEGRGVAKCRFRMVGRGRASGTVYALPIKPIAGNLNEYCQDEAISRDPIRNSELFSELGPSQKIVLDPVGGLSRAVVLGKLIRVPPNRLYHAGMVIVSHTPAPQTLEPCFRHRPGPANALPPDSELFWIQNYLEYTIFLWIESRPIAASWKYVPKPRATGFFGSVCTVTKTLPHPTVQKQEFRVP